MICVCLFDYSFILPSIYSESLGMKSSSSLECWAWNHSSRKKEERQENFSLLPLKWENDWLGTTPFGLRGCRKANSLKCWGSTLFSCVASWEAQLSAGIQYLITTQSQRKIFLAHVSHFLGEKVLRPLGYTATWRCWCLVFFKRLLRYGRRIWRVLNSADSCNKSSRERSERCSSQVL